VREGPSSQKLFRASNQASRKSVRIRKKKSFRKNYMGGGKTIAMGAEKKLRPQWNSMGEILKFGELIFGVCRGHKKKGTTHPEGKSSFILKRFSPQGNSRKGEIGVNNVLNRGGSVTLG